ncbi:VOC family protein [Thalassomonas actiniarum]|uniref:VOC family protein n=1 Tax=Thalassomonas actiniarum TaxID=485447 RepID=A0AAE9YS66_9GAMM|nr:VOC family protein [Thalassomonas actiniarum]WDD99299.1 VOC family protein [Thalassomonas actiniarum]
MNFPNMLLSHVELYVQDIVQMEQFYTQTLGFIVTDRGEGKNGMVFLSRSPHEHHQIVLNPVASHRTFESPVDHISFRVESLAELRIFNASLAAIAEMKFQTVSHGTTWSIYFRDPENNRFEIFTDTPWYVNQPCKFPVDFTLADEELIKFTENKIKALPGFALASDWNKTHKSSLAALKK